MKVLIFFATYNEAGNVRPLIKEIGRVAPLADILIVDDNSSDGTLATLRDLRCDRLHVLVRPGKLGLGTAHLLAWKYAIHKHYDILITMDGDQSHDAADIPRLVDKLGSGFDLVIGSRYTAGGVCDYTGYRKHVSKVGNLAARLLLRIRLSEFTTSFRAFKVAQLKKMDFGSLVVGGYSFFMTAIVQAYRNGLRIGEIPIHFHERGYGSSKIPPLEVVRGMANLVRLACLGLVPKPAVGHANRELACGNCGVAYSRMKLQQLPRDSAGPPAVVAPYGAGAADICLYCGRPGRARVMTAEEPSLEASRDK